MPCECQLVEHCHDDLLVMSKWTHFQLRWSTQERLPSGQSRLYTIMCLIEIVLFMI